MLIKYTGAVLIVLGCAGTGFCLAASHCRELRMLRDLIAALDYMQCELNYRLTPLPQLCRMSGTHIGGEVGRILLMTADEMDKQIQPDAVCCLNMALQQRSLPPLTAERLRLVGNCLGQFDLSGQLTALREQRVQCASELDKLLREKDQRLRSYRTLGICAGAALSILLL